MAKPIGGKLTQRIKRARALAVKRGPRCRVCGLLHIPVRLEKDRGYVSRLDPAKVWDEMKGYGAVENEFIYALLVWSNNRRPGRFDESKGDGLEYCRCAGCGCAKVWAGFVKAADSARRESDKREATERAVEAKRKAAFEAEREVGELARTNELACAARRAARKSAARKPESEKPAGKYTGNLAWANDPIYRYPPRSGRTWRASDIERELSL